MKKGESAPEDHIAIYDQLCKAFADRIKVTECLHDYSSLAIDIAHCTNVPKRGVTAFSTIGLSDHTLHSKKSRATIGIELAGACYRKYSEEYFTIVGSVAFCAIRSGRIFSPGEYVEGYVEEYHKSEMKHIYFTAPFLWEETLSSLSLPSKKVLWLMLVPISDAELMYFKKHGEAAFEKLLEKESVDVYDLDRKSVV